MMRDLGVPLSRGGLVSAGLFIGNASAIVILNTVLARSPAKTILISGTLLQAVALAVAGAASRDLWSLFAAYLFVGFGGALINTTCWIWISAHMVQNRAASALRMILFFALAMIAVPLIIGLALDAGASWRWMLIAEGGLELVSALALVSLPLLDVCGRQNVRLTQFRQVLASNRRLLLGMMAAGFLYTGTEMTMNIWMPKFQIDVFSSSDTLAGLAVTLFWVGLIAGRLLVTTLTQRFSPARLVLVCSCVFAVFAVAVALAPSQGVSLVLAVGAASEHPPPTASSGATRAASRDGSPRWLHPCSSSPAASAASPSPTSWARWPVRRDSGSGWRCSPCRHSPMGRRRF